MSKQRINRKDKDRALLTETTPYELPLIISNNGFHKNIQNKNIRDSLLVKKVLEQSDPTISLSYKIIKDNKSHRKLSCPHPAAQLQLSNLYTEYDSLILFLCNKSNFSLRRPYKIASYYYEQSHKDSSAAQRGLVEIEELGLTNQQTHASSYYSYKKYALLYKFYESFEYQSLEKKFSHLLKFDISKCFDSIYTHSIAWAVKNKSYAKLNQGHSFEALFDKLIRNANHGETNGIIIGPEICRIFAEIILQRIDRDVVLKLNSMGISDQQYSVRRYVDDYFVFSATPDIANMVFSTFKGELEKHKLYVNDSKTENFVAPFITTITAAKNQIHDRVSDILYQTLPETSPELHITTLCTPNSLSQKLIKTIKETLLIHDVDFHSISGRCLSTINQHLKRATLALQKKEIALSPLFSFFFALLETAFFIASMSPRVRSIYLVINTSILTLKVCPQLSYDDAHNLKKKIFDECLLLLRKIGSNQRYEKTNTIEFTNLLICLSLLGDDYLLDEHSLTELVDWYLPEDPTEALGYFEITALLFYIKDLDQYSKFRADLSERIVSILHNETIAIYSESAHLMFDAISCPYITETVKSDIIKQSYLDLKLTTPTKKQIEDTIACIGTTHWFCDWRPDLNLESLLEKKSLKYLY